MALPGAARAKVLSTESKSSAGVSIRSPVARRDVVGQHEVEPCAFDILATETIVVVGSERVYRKLRREAG